LIRYTWYCIIYSAVAFLFSSLGFSFIWKKYIHTLIIASYCAHQRNERHRVSARFVLVLVSYRCCWAGRVSPQCLSRSRSCCILHKWVPTPCSRSLANQNQLSRHYWVILRIISVTFIVDNISAMFYCWMMVDVLLAEGNFACCRNTWSVIILVDFDQASRVSIIIIRYMIRCNHIRWWHYMINLALIISFFSSFLLFERRIIFSFSFL
jgi:hypothetical protein